MPPSRRKPGVAISSILNSYKVESLIIGPVERSLISKPREYRDQDHIHPTDLIKDDYCVRAAFFNLKAKYEVQRIESARMESVFAEGHKIHDKWQEWERDEGWLEGLWKCRVCETKHWFMSNNLPHHCPNCAIHWKDSRGEWSLVVYAEVPMEYKPLMISGHADGKIYRNYENPFLQEIKSIGMGSIRYGAPSLVRGSLEESFKQITSPFVSHSRQGQLYMRICEMLARWSLENGDTLTYERYKDIEKTVFLYECKANQEPKEFTVYYDPEVSDPYIDLAQTVSDAMRADVPPACNQGDGCKRCAKVDAA